MLRPAERQPFQNPGHWCAYARGAGYQSSGFTSIGHQANDLFLAPGQPADRTDAGIRHNKGSPLSPVFSMLSKKQERRPMRMINVPTKTAVMVVAVALILMASDSQMAPEAIQTFAQIMVEADRRSAAVATVHSAPALPRMTAA